jgi:zinc transport system substrate-binding protein
MKKASLCVLSFLLCFVCLSLTAEENKDLRSHKVLVSIAPYKYFVEKIAGDTVKVHLIVPAGASAHTYEPTPRQMLESTQADAWFYVGEGFENKVRTSLQSYNPRMQFFDMRANVNLISYNDKHQRCCHHHDSSYDLHYWLSPKEAQAQIQTIADALAKLYPENADLYKKNYKTLSEELIQLDHEIKSILSQPHNPVIMVSHPAYAYFCRDYDCKQLSIEFEGKDPTPSQLTQILTDAKKHKIKTIFVQVQYSSKGAKLIADRIGAKVVNLDPYSENYRNSLLEIAQAFAAQPEPN